MGPEAKFKHSCVQRILAPIEEEIGKQERLLAEMISIGCELQTAGAVLRLHPVIWKVMDRCSQMMADACGAPIQGGFNIYEGDLGIYKVEVDKGAAISLDLGD
jgi:hypothetical protein